MKRQSRVLTFSPQPSALSLLFFLMGEIVAAVAISSAVGIGSSLLVNALTPAQTVKTGGLGDLNVPKTNYGAIIPQCWGQGKLASILLWATKKREVTETENQGGKGGPRVRNERTTYFGNFAVMFSYCPARPTEQLKRLWFNEQLVYDAESTDPDTISASAEFLTNHLRFYNGTADQSVDPLMQNAEPIQTFDYGLPHDPTERASVLSTFGLPPDTNHITAYHNKCYAVIENLDLTPYGGQIPAVKAEILFNPNNNLAQIITDLCLQIDYDNIDATSLSGIPVAFFYLDKITSIKELFKTLQQAYFFDIIQIRRGYLFTPHTSTRDTISIPLEELAAHEGGSSRPKTFELPDPDPYDLPASVEVNFIDLENGFDGGNAIARSQVTNSRKKESFNFLIAMTSKEAQKLAENLLHKFYLEAIKPSDLALAPKYGFLEVGDRLNISFFEEEYTLQIVKIQEGANRLLKFATKVVEAANTNNIVTAPTPISDGGHNPPITGTTTIRISGATTLEVMDINLVRDDDDDRGLYVSAYGGSNWRECSLYASKDDSSYFFVDTLTRGTIGTLASTLDETSTSFQVALNSGELVSISDTDYDSGLNKILVGNEILQFRDRALVGSNDELSTLRRGLRGTENFINSHSIGERVVLLAGSGAAVKRIPGSLADLGEIRYFKAPSPGQTLAAAATVSLTVEGNALKPYSPVNLVATSNLLDDILIRWDRRDRKAGDATVFENLPLSEATEEYDLEIYDGGTLVKTISLNSSEYVYPKADQVTDFGAIQTNLTIKLYQISADVGRGYEAGGTLSITLEQPPPKITKVLPETVNYPGEIQILGSGLSDIIAVKVGDALASNVVIVDDTKITCDITKAESIGQNKIYLYTSDNSYLSDGITPVDLELFNFETAEEIVNVISRQAIAHGILLIYQNARTITSGDLNRLLICDTNAEDVIITLDSTVLNNLFSDYDPIIIVDPALPGGGGWVGTRYSFNVNVQNGGTGKVIFEAGSSDTLLAKSFVLENQYDTASWIYYGTNEWRGFGALY